MVMMKYNIFTIVLMASLSFTHSGLADDKSQKDDVQTSGEWLTAGIGGAWFGNINSTKSYTGFMLGISIGVL
jgi:hypothetical protein